MAAIAAATATVMLQPLPFFVVSFVVSFPTSSSIFASVVEGMFRRNVDARATCPADGDQWHFPRELSEK